MTSQPDLTKLEEWAETLAILVAQYYQTLIRNNVPEDLARALTGQYQERILQQQPRR